MRNAPAYLYAVDMLESDPLLWRGVSRIHDELQSRPSRDDREETLWVRLLLTLRARRRELPSELSRSLLKEERK